MIRKMTIDDYDQVYSLWINTPGMGLNSRDDSKEGIGQYLARNPETCFVSEEDGEINGVILCGNDGRRGFIHHTAVAVKNRKQGIGGALVCHALKALEEQHIYKVALVAFERNEIGNRFWENQGFSVREDLVYRNKSIQEAVRIDT